MNVILPHVARNGSAKERWRLFVVGLASIYEGLVIALSLGYFTVDTRAWVLFDLFEDD